MSLFKEFQANLPLVSEKENTESTGSMKQTVDLEANFVMKGTLYISRLKLM